MNSKGTQRWIKNSCRWWETSPITTTRMDRWSKLSSPARRIQNITLLLVLILNQRVPGELVILLRLKLQSNIRVNKISSRNRRRNTKLTISLMCCSTNLTSVGIKSWLDPLSVILLLVVSIIYSTKEDGTDLTIGL